MSNRLHIKTLTRTETGTITTKSQPGPQMPNMQPTAQQRNSPNTAPPMKQLIRITTLLFSMLTLIAPSAFSQATYPKICVIGGDTLLAVTIPQAKEINRTYNLCRLLQSDNDALTAHIATQDSVIAEMDTIILTSAKYSSECESLADSLFYQNALIKKELATSTRRTKKLAYYCSVATVIVVILTTVLIK